MVISMVCDTLLDTILGHKPALKIGVGAFKRTNHSRRKKLVTALSINLVEKGIEEGGSLWSLEWKPSSTASAKHQRGSREMWTIHGLLSMFVNYVDFWIGGLRRVKAEVSQGTPQMWGHGREEQWTNPSTQGWWFHSNLFIFQINLEDRKRMSLLTKS